MHLSPRVRNILIAGCLLVGSGLRLIWPDDMEWKSEEQWMFEQAEYFAHNDVPLPWSGILSSVGIPNPGLGLWVFIAIAKFARDPVEMVRWVQGINVLVLWAFLGFIVWQIAAPQRRVWLWGLAITAVNPFAILFARKIWIPDILAPFCLMAFIGHWFRHKFFGGFLWGAASLLAAQIHMGGFFYTVGFVLWTIWIDAQRQSLRKVSWVGFALGAAIASVPLWFWLQDALRHQHDSHSNWVGLLFPKFYVQWVTSALGVNLSYSLKGIFWSDFLRQPILAGYPTFLIAIAHLFLVAMGCIGLYQWVRHQRVPLKQFLRVQPQPDLSDYLKGMSLGVGGAFSLSAMNVVPYYIPIVFPFQYLWLAKLYEHREKVIVSMIAAQLAISLTFLTFIHTSGGFEYPTSDYGKTYRMQHTGLLPTRSATVEGQAILKTVHSFISE
jgi:hypothetical protein